MIYDSFEIKEEDSDASDLYGPLVVFDFVDEQLKDPNPITPPNYTPAVQTALVSLGIKSNQ